MAASHCAAALLLAALLPTALSVALRPPTALPWDVRTTSSELTAVFGGGAASFDVTDNWRICHTGASFTVLDHGNVTDFTAEISGYLASAGAAGGGLLTFGPGVFPISGALAIPARTCLLGAGMDATTIRLLDGAPPLLAPGVLHSAGAARVSVLSLTVDANRGGQGGALGASVFAFAAPEHAWFRSVRAANTCGSGFSVSGSAARNASYVMFEGCVADGNCLDGFHLASAQRTSVATSIAARNGRHGVAVAGASRAVVVRQNKILENGRRAAGCGVSVTASAAGAPRDVVVAGLEIVDAFRAGVCVNGAGAVDVSESTIANGVDAGAACYSFVDAQFCAVRSVECKVRSNLVNGPQPTPMSSPPATPAPSVSPFAAVSSSPTATGTASATATATATPSTTPSTTPTATPSASPSATSSATPSGSATATATATASATATPSPTASKSMPSGGGDATCALGIVFKDVCCPAACGSCGGRGCGSRLSGGACCVEAIRSEGRSCAGALAPCVIPVPVVTSPLPTVTAAASASAVSRPSLPVAVPTVSALPGDAMCARGVAYKDVCCPARCGVCSGRGCGQRGGGGGECCADVIREDARSCLTHDAPCVLPMPSPAVARDPQCRSGVLFKDVCCPDACGKCGGVGCSLRLPFQACCVSTVRKMGRSCESNGPPCTLLV